jgi:pimeloyl-ACP methyl ester carboxylesterase
MKIKNYLSFVIMFFTVYSYGIQDTEKLYSTTFLKDYKSVRTLLHKAGFQKIFLTTSDGLTLSGLFLSRPHATCNVIVCAGWLPGRKEGMATFYDLLPENCNILFFDARGHGESEGSLLWGVWRYGIDEYKDIVGAVSWINADNDLPIVIAGICSGAFNAAHAILCLEKNNLLALSKVKGLVFDSGWGSVLKVITTAPVAGIKKRIAAALRSLYTTKRTARHSYLYQASSYCAQHLCTLGNYVCALPLTTQYNHITNLSDKIGQISVPIFFIHSYGDTYANMDDAVKLADLTPNKQCWWIAQSSHAKHHLIHKELYKEKLALFIATATEQ